MPGRRLATESLYAGLQLLMPGETAPCHRHSPVALRFVIEGSGAYTTVDGVRAYMQPGDLIVTPAWAWHEHGHDGEGPTVWLDVLDVAMIHLFTASFAELRPMRGTAAAAAGGSDGDGRDAEERADAARVAPAFSYSYASARAAIDRLRAGDAPDACHGFRREYTDPVTGEPAIPTIATALQLLPGGFESAAYRSTAGALLCVVEGEGVVTIGEGDRARDIRYGPWDIIAAPAWMPRRFVAASDSIVFSASDEAAQRKLGFFRERRG